MRVGLRQRLDSWQSAPCVGITLLTLLLYGALGALLVLVPFGLIQVARYSAFGAGTALLPFALVLALASPLMGALAGRIGPRMPLTIGPLVVAVGFALVLRIGADANYWTAVFASVDSRHTGAASGLNSAVARTGGMAAAVAAGA